MRGLNEYLSDLIKTIFTATGRLPVEVWVNQAQHPYIKDLTDRRFIGIFDLVQIHVSKEVEIGSPEYILNLDRPSQKIQFAKEEN
jgi:hypothetical protein